MKKYLSIFILGLISSSLFSQDLAPTVIASAGSDIQSGGKRIAFTVGELIVTTVGGNGYILTQGFQQPPNMYLVDLNKSEISKIDVHVFPNPTKDIVNISIRDVSIDKEFIIEVFNSVGQKLYLPVNQHDVSGGKNFSLDISEYGHGTYYIRVYSPSEQKLYADFKVIKVN